MKPRTKYRFLAAATIVVAAAFVIAAVVFRRNETFFHEPTHVPQTQVENKIYSQNGEDGVIITIFQLIGYTNRYYVEFGVEDGNECNTRALREYYGFTGLLMDGGYENNDINLRKEFITRDNVISLFEKYNVPESFDLLSVDVDGNDIHICDAILTKYKPRVIVIEYNSILPHSQNLTIVYDPDFQWDKSNYFGASLGAVKVMGEAYGYTVVYCDNNGVNTFLVRNEDVHRLEATFPDMNNLQNIFRDPGWNNGTGHAPDSKGRNYVPYIPRGR